MPSTSLTELQTRLADVNELILAHTVVTGGGPGKPAKRQGAAITRAGVVLLAAAMEAFVEDLFVESGELVFAAVPPADRQKLYEQTSKKLNNADSNKTNLLYFNLGCPWILATIKWKKFSNPTFIARLNKLVENRNQIAHGKRPNVTLPQLRTWKKMLDGYAPRLEGAVAAHIEKMTGVKPAW
jgi:hypothetical protein